MDADLSLRAAWAILHTRLRERAERLRGRADVDSLYLVSLDLALRTTDDDVRTIIESLEDCGVGE